jgi:hypothetical protein
MNSSIAASTIAARRSAARSVRPAGGRCAPALVGAVRAFACRGSDALPEVDAVFRVVIFEK